MSTYAEFKDKPSSSKGVLVRLGAAKRLSGFTLYSGSIYSLVIDQTVIESIEEDGTALTSVASIGLVVAGSYFFDESTKTVYLRTTTSAHPNGKFITLNYCYFFSNIPATLHQNPDLATGKVVYWEPMVIGTSQFGFEIDNKELDQIGNAIDGSGSVDLVNDLSFWGPIYDSVVFENREASIFSWSPQLNEGEAQLIYRGIIDARSYSETKIGFTLRDQLAELKAPVDLANMEDVVGARLTSKQNLYKQRRVYGRVKGHVCLSIDQVGSSGYPLTGTFTVVGASDTLTGTTTQFLAELSPGDQILLNGSTEKITVGDVITSNTSLTLSEPYEGTNFTSVSATVFPSRPKRWINRTFFLAGHALREPQTTITGSFGVRTIQVASGTDILQGDPLVVNGEVTSVQRISGDGFTIKLAQTLAVPAPNGATVTRPSISNVYINDELLIENRDYTYDAAAAELYLDDLAEFNVTKTELLRGNSQFTSASRQVDGTSTTYTEEFQPGDWIKCVGQADWFEVLYIESDTRLFLRTASTYSATDQTQRKRPDVYDEKATVLSCDVLGKTVTGVKSGALLDTGPAIVKDILTEIGLSSIIDNASFATASDLAQYKLGLVIPAKVTETKTKVVRDYINQINKTVFGSLIQKADFTLQYKIFNPRRPEASTTELTQSDILKFSINSDSKRIVKKARILWGFREYDGPSIGGINFEETYESDIGLYLTKTNKEFTVETLFANQKDAIIFASRWAFLLALSSATLKIETKLKPADKSVTDIVKVSHPKFYDRVGSSIKSKYAAIQSSKKTASNVSLELEDLANAFSRCSAIVDAGSPNYTNSDDADILLSGFITDQYGLLSNDAATITTNLIW